MAQKRKKHPSPTAHDPGLLQGDRDTKKMDPTARKLLLLSVVLIALAQILEGRQLISHGAGDLLALLSLLSLGGFFVVQAKSKKGSGL